MSTTTHAVATPSLFDPAANRAVIARIERLTPQTRALWGKMSVARMLAHCERPLLVACGGLVLKRGLIGILFGGMAKKSLLKPKPFDKGLPTAPEFKVPTEPDFAAAKATLTKLVARFAAEGPAILTKHPHPFFGALTEAEWDALQWKHLDHHLRQFGA